MDKVKGATRGKNGWGGKTTIVDGEGYPHGVIWIDEHDKKDSTIMLISEAHNHYDLWTRHVINNEYTEWKKATSFHDYELEELALAILERVVDKEIIISQVLKAEEG